MAGSQSLSLGEVCWICSCKKLTYHSGEELLGYLCKSCWKEWLLETCLSTTSDSLVTHNGRRYFSPKLVELGPSPVNTSRVEINPKDAARSFKPGDHIMWHRIPFEWHHAIVEDVNDTMLTLIHYKKETDSTIIQRTTTDAEKEQGTLYLITYSPQVKQYNPPELVLARARALIGMDGSTILQKNCENFVTFCKSGINIKQKPEWFNNKMVKICDAIAHTEGLSNLFKKDVGGLLQSMILPAFNDVVSQVSIGVIIAYEGGRCILNLTQLFMEYIKKPKKGQKNLSRKDFIEMIIKQVSRCFLTVTVAGCALKLAAVGTLLCPGLGTVGGAVLGIIAGCTGYVLGRALGMSLGEFVSHAIAKTIKTNDRAVNVEDLKPGDHIVLYGNLVHPRCHAIFVEDCSEKDMIVVIRRTYKFGIIRDYVGYKACGTIFRMSYSSSLEAYSSEEIIMRAIKAVADSNVGSSNYNILWNNCKHFVYGITLKGDSTLKYFPP